MHRLTIAVAVVTGLLGAAAPVMAGEKDDFLAACNKRTDGQAVELCICKADFATKTLDGRMLGYVIAAMGSDKTDIPEDVLTAWNDYVAQSNATCKPGY